MRALGADMRHANGLDRRVRHALVGDFTCGLCVKLREFDGRRRHVLDGNRQLELSHRPDIGQAHAERRKNSGERVNED